MILALATNMSLAVAVIATLFSVALLSQPYVRAFGGRMSVWKLGLLHLLLGAAVYVIARSL
jgi:hypothetical protein